MESNRRATTAEGATQFSNIFSATFARTREFSYEQFPLRRINRVTRAVAGWSLVERTKSSTSNLRENRWNASCCRIYVRRANMLCCSRCRFEPVPRVPPTYESGPLIRIVPGAEVDRETAEVSGGSRRTRSYAKRELRGDTDYIQNFLRAVHVNSAQRSRSFILDKTRNLCQSVKSYF